jgi:Fe-S oxidoreductase
MCRFACPIAQAEQRETVHPTSKMTLLHLLNTGGLQWSREVAETFFRCTGCLISRTFCEHRIEVFPPLVVARQEAVRHGVAPERVMEQDKVVAQYHNPYGENLGKKLDGYVPSRFVRKDAAVLFFVGCTTTQFYDKHIKAAIKLMEVAGADLGVYVDDYLCCGYPSYALGHTERFEDIAARVAKNIGRAPTIVTVCPTCATTLRDLYPQVGARIESEVLHISQFLYPHMKSGQIAFKKTVGRVLYHDPCHLGRYMGVYDQPRELLRTACRELIEFPWTREESQCCGGGGGLLLTARDTAKEIARIRAEFAREAAPDILASACPTCDRTLERAWDRKSVLDLVRILADSLVEK